MTFPKHIEEKVLTRLEKNLGWDDWSHHYEAGVICSTCRKEVTKTLDIYWENTKGDGIVEHICRECWFLGEL